MSPTPPRFPSPALLARLAPLGPVAGCPGIVAHAAARPYELWDAWEQECGATCEIPFWAVVWPAGRVLAAWLLEHPDPVAGRSVLDLGCGGAVAAIAAARAGARSVLAVDPDPVARHLAGLNARASGVTLSLADWDPGAVGALPPVDVILAADLFYVRSEAAHTLALLDEARRHGAEVIVADAERAFAPRERVAVFHERTVPVNHDLEGKPERRVRLMHLTD